MRLAEIASWEKERAGAEIRERASARLAQKALEPTGSATDEYSQLGAKLREVADRMSKQLTVRKEWAAMEKTAAARDAFKLRMSERWTELDAAMKRLGADKDLFVELPVKPDDDFASTPFMRPAIPDLRGVTATLYLDGKVVWSPPLREALR
jgi:hypothetical protein